MRRFGKRILSSLQLRKQRTSRSSSNSSSSTDQCSARTRRRESSTDHGTVDAGAGNSSQQSPQQQLHWSEARRIYSEPATREMKIDRGSSSGRDSSSTCSSSNLAPGHAHGGASSLAGKIKGKRRRNHDDRQTLCRSCAEEADSQCGGESDGEEEDDDDDDVFLESWEEVAAAVISAESGQCFF